MKNRKNPRGFGLKETYPEVENIGQLISPIKYVIFQPAKEDYFAGEEGDSLVVTNRWCPTPGGTKKFLKLKKAEAKAREIVARKGYSLQICELYETEQQFMTSVIAEIKE